MTDGATTRDAFLDGKVTLIQPANGSHRSGSDAVFLAACLTGTAGLILDMGAGAGAVGLMIAATNPLAHVHLAERDPHMLSCCRHSLDENANLAARVAIVPVDLCAGERARIEAGLHRAAYDHIVSNPPYRKAGHVRISAAKQSAHVIDGDTLEAWMRTAASCLKPGGSVTMIFAADGLTDLLRVFAGRFGAITIKGLHPRADLPAERVLVRAVKGRKTPLRLLPGLVVHERSGDYSTAARAVLDGRAPIRMAAD